jgi:hypothetical protein
MIEAWLSPETRAALRPILDYSMLIKNGSSKPIAAVTLVWNLKNEHQVPITHAQCYQTFLLDRSQLLLTGDVLFIAPKSGLSRKIKLGESTKLRGDSINWNSKSLFESQPSISVQIDTLVFSDGLVEGKDKSMTMSRINQSLRAEKDLMQGLLDVDPLNMRSALLDKVQKSGQTQKSIQ